MNLTLIIFLILHTMFQYLIVSNHYNIITYFKLYYLNYQYNYDYNYC